MIFTKATKYNIQQEKMKVFVDYLYVFVKKARMETHNLSFEYGLNTNTEVVVLERWSSKQDFESFLKKEGINNEISTLEKMSIKTTLLYQFNSIK